MAEIPAHDASEHSIAATGVRQHTTGELKANALGLGSSVVIGVASAAPAYSLAAVLGVLAAEVGVHIPATLIVGFVPMGCIAAAYYYMNRADPNCGTAFAWASRSLGPYAGWMSGWAMLAADFVVIASLAGIAGRYTLLLFGLDSLAECVPLVTAVGVLWIALMSVITLLGIELSAKTQATLLTAEISVLIVFAVTALAQVYLHKPSGSMMPATEWFLPTGISGAHGMASGVLVAIFAYWGWDTSVCLNEEAKHRSKVPGLAAVISTLLLLGTYVLVATAALAFAGSNELAASPEDALTGLGRDLFGYPFDRLLIVAVLTSAAASIQSTILPSARTAFSMARAGAIPAVFATVHPRFLTPHVSTLSMGAGAILWYVGLTAASSHVLSESISALGLMISFYLAVAGIACLAYYRRHILTSISAFFLVGIPASVGVLSFVYVFIESASMTAHAAGSPWFGVGLPLVIAVGLGLVGILLMLLRRLAAPTFFQRRGDVTGCSLVARIWGDSDSS